MNMSQDGCVICGKEKKFKKAQTCSRECAVVAKRRTAYEERVCIVCNSKFEERKKYERKMCSEECRRDWNSRPENIKAKHELSKKAVLDKYGVENVFSAEHIKEVIAKKAASRTVQEKELSKQKKRRTKLEKYGSETFNNMDLIKKTKTKKYGDENFNNRQKASQTMSDRLGVPFAMQSEEVKKKAKQTSIENYGVYHPMKNREHRERVMKTNLEKYGSEHIMKVEGFKKKVSDTWSKKLTKSKFLLESLPKYDIKLLSDVTSFSTPSYQGRKYVDFQFECLKCGHQFSRTFATPTIPICRVCNPSNKQPRTHEHIRNILVDSGIHFIENDRRTLGNAELDFFIPSKNLAIEVNGNYFHAERSFGCDKSYHISKTKKCHERDIKLIHIFEDELKKKSDIVSSRIKNLLGISERREYARNLEVRVVDRAIASKFFDSNHIQGNANQASHHLGLFDADSNLLSAISFGVLREALGNRSKDGSFELYRFCSLLDTNVVGAFSKLLKHFIRTESPKYILTYADVRWSGMDHLHSVYAACGFNYVELTKPNYWYFKKGDYNSRHHRFSYRRSVLLKIAEQAGLSVSEDSTEWQIAQLLGMDRIWDCGSMKFELNYS